MHLSRYLIILYCLLPGFLHAQHAVFRHYTTREGLPSSEIYCVLQDSKGYMWFGTDRGLLRFDGNQFITYSTTEGLADNAVFTLREGLGQRIWYSGYSSRMGYIEAGKAGTYLFNDLLRQTLQAQLFRSLIPDSNDGFFISYLKQDTCSDILHIDRQGKISVLTDKADSNTQYIYISSDGHCLNSYHSLCPRQTRICNLERKQLLATIEQAGRPNPDAFCSRLKDGSLILCLNQVLWQIKNGRAFRLADCPYPVLDMTTDRQGNIWLGTLHNGLFLYDAAVDYRQPRLMLADLSVSGTLLDREGGLWFSTLEDGIYYLPADYCFSYNKSDGLSSAKVNAIIEIKGQGIIALSDWQILRRGTDGVFDQAPERFWGNILDIATAGNDTIYCAGNGIPSTLLGHKTIIFPGISKLQIISGRIYGLSPGGITIYNTRGNILDRIGIKNTTRITSVQPLADSSLLIGTLEGILRYHNGRIYPLRKKHPLLGSQIGSILPFDEDHLLIATIGQGLLLLHLPDYRVIQYGTREGLPSMICPVLLKQDSVVWAGTNKGICRITGITMPATARFHITDISNGIISDEINDLQIIGDELWIGTTHGLSVKPLASFQPDTSFIPIHLHAVMVNGKSRAGALSAPIPYKQNNISISFTAVNYQYNKRLKYRYRLTGLQDTGWQLTATPSVHYNALAPGNYTFEVYAVGIAGMQSSILSYSFRIKAPFWSTWWFLSLLLLLTASGLYLFIRLRLRHIREQVRIKHTLEDYREKALRLQMNPHFIYNCMNSIQNYIRKNETEASISFLSKFSYLMRMSFHNAGVEMITLEKDLEALRVYAEMEQMRFPGKFHLDLRVEHNINTSGIFVPPLLLQPFVENAILHAFVYKTTPGQIKIRIQKERQRLKISIRDDGIGIHKALLIRKRKDQYLPSSERKISGTNITVARIRQVWGNRLFPNMFQATDLSVNAPETTGTLIQFYIPIKYDQDYSR